MKLLLDENIPVKLKYRLLENGIPASTVKDMQWFGKQNGELLQLMLKNEFTSFLTIDNNISFQQNFRDYPLQVLVLIAPDNSYGTIMEFFDLILAKFKISWTGVTFIEHK